MEKVNLSDLAVQHVADYLAFLNGCNRPQESYIAEDGSFAIKENNVVLRVYVKPGDKPGDELQTDRIEISNEYATDEITIQDLELSRLPKYVPLKLFKKLPETLQPSIDKLSHEFASGVQERSWVISKNPFLSLEQDINKLHDRVPFNQSFLK